MSETAEDLQRKIKSARELKSVVRTMKMLAALSIVQYERAIRSLADYYHAVELGLGACFREKAAVHTLRNRKKPLTDPLTAAIVFGSDQGLVGQFNDHLAQFVLAGAKRAARSKVIWRLGNAFTPGSRIQVSPKRLYSVPNSVAAITPLISQILIDNENLCEGRRSVHFS